MRPHDARQANAPRLRPRRPKRRARLSQFTSKHFPINSSPRTCQTDGSRGHERLLPASDSLGGSLVDVNIRNPIFLSAQEARRAIFIFKIGSLPAQSGRVKVFKCVDVYNSVKSIINLTCHNRHRTAAGTNVKRRGLRTE